jgi:hypothetical protein
MAINYGTKLSDLRLRRLGIDRDPSLYIERSALTERYEKRATGAATRYALGAMQEVEPRYTEISIEECVRIANQLINGLKSESKTAEFRLQGSVPLNTHIRGVSDVDFLVILGFYFWYDRDGVKASLYTPHDISMLFEVTSLRRSCEEILRTKFPAVTVDVSGSKSIRLSGGSLRREIDVVPSSWFNSKDYQRLESEHYRGVSILDESVPQMIHNYPFLHIKQISDKDVRCNGGAKMAVRLLKNIKNDSDQDIRLSSYELASVVWHAADVAVTDRPGFEMGVLAGIDLHLSALISDYASTCALRTPDNTRAIIDEPAKFLALVKLSQEVSALANAVLSEAPSALRNALGLPPASSRRVLSELYIPAV